MVKTLWTISVTLVLLVGLGIFEHFFVEKQFDELKTALYVLYDKIEDETAQTTDAESVKTIVEQGKKKICTSSFPTPISQISTIG